MPFLRLGGGCVLLRLQSKSLSLGADVKVVLMLHFLRMRLSWGPISGHLGSCLMVFDGSLRVFLKEKTVSGGVLGVDDEDLKTVYGHW